MRDRLALSDVIASTYRAFPLIESARLQSVVARGQTTSALGAYDYKLDYYSLNQPVGFYETSRSGVSVARQLWWGGYASAGYRIGRGQFEPWYKERETNKGGEVRVGWIQPLLQGRAIDPMRVELFQSNLNRQGVSPEIQQNILSASLDASRAYWQWVESGNVLIATKRLHDLSLERGQALERKFAAGLGSRQEVAINAQTISERQIKVFDAQQKFKNAAFKLGIFLRDDSGNPMMASADWLPTDFPSIGELPPGDFEADYQSAQMQRPELALVQIEIQKLRWELSLAHNQMLPSVDFTIQGVQNMGDPATPLNDKGEFQLESGIVGNVPVQRRKARGKIDAALAKLQQLEQKRVLQLNKIEVDLRTARNDLEMTRQEVARAQQLVQETTEVLNYFRKAFDAGNRDFLFLLQQEAKVTEAEIRLLDSERDFFSSLATMQAALGLDPLEQSLVLEESKK